MTILSNFGIYSGGEVTKEGSNQISIAPYMVSLSNGELRGSGSFSNTYSKKIIVGFSSTAPSSSGYNRQNILDPQYLLTVNTTAAGQAFIVFDSTVNDVQVIVSSTAPSSSVILFAKLSWNGGTTSLAGITIDITNRTESRIAKTFSPSRPELFFQDGQPYTSSAVNRQYANLAVAMEVLQDQSLLSFSNEYFVTFAKEVAGDIYGSGTKVILKPFKNISRQDNDYIIYDLKEDDSALPSGSAFVHDFTDMTSVRGLTVYVSVNKTTAEPVISTSYNSTTHYLIAYAQVGSLETDLANVSFKVVNNLIGHNTFVENVSRLLTSTKTNGFLNKVNITELEQDNKIRFESNILNIDGYLLLINGEDIELPAPPSSGSRQDFVYIEIEKNSIPWTVLTYKFKVVSDVNLSQYDDPFENPLVMNDDNNTYSYSRSGAYTANLASNSVDGKTHAIPLVTVQRLTTQDFSVNYKGGNGRIDGKSAERIKLSEVEVKAPENTTKEKVELLNSALFKLLEGNLNNKLKPSNLDNTFFSRKPLQIDRLGSNTSVINTNFAGLTDGIRYLWSKNISKTPYLYALINSGSDSGVLPYDFSTVSYDADTFTVMVQVPNGTDAELVRLPNGDLDGVFLKWASTGNPVKLTSNWSIGQARTSTAIIDPMDVDYISDGDIVIMFKVRYTDITSVGLSQIPSNVIAAALNGDFNSYSSSFAVSLASFTTSDFVKNLNRSITVSGNSYTDYLSLIKMGSNTKYNSYELHYFTPGNNSNLLDYEIDASLMYTDQIDLLGLINVVNAVTKESLQVTKVKWTYNTTNKFLIRLSLNVPVTDPVEFIFATAGKQIDLSSGSLEITNLTETYIHAKNGSIVSNPEGVYFITNGKISYGALSLRSDNKVFVGEDLVPCTIEGFGTNLLKVTIQVDNISAYTTGNWYLNSSINKYVPNNGATIRLPVLQSYMTDNNHIHIAYEYNSLPFIPFNPSSGSYSNDNLSESNLPYTTAESAYVVNRGFLIKSNDGAANSGDSEYSPVCDRFPVVQGIESVGIGIDADPIGMTDPFQFQQQKKPFIEGTKINMLGELILSGTVLGGTGVAVWAALIKQLNCLRLFVYEVRDGAFVLNNKDQAFICELESNFREKI